MGRPSEVLALGQVPCETEVSSMGEMHSANGMPPSTPNLSDSQYQSDSGSPTGGTHASDYKVRSSRLLKIVNWWHILTVYLPSIQLFLLFLFLSQVAYDAKHNHHDLKQQVEVSL